MLRLPDFNIVFQLELTKCFKSELFSCLPKVDHVIKVMHTASDYNLVKQNVLGYGWMALILAVYLVFNTFF